MLGPVLEGQLIRLEAAQTSDLDIFRAWFADLEITRYLLSQFVPSEQQEVEWYQRVSNDPAVIHWKIVAAGRTIGGTDLIGVDLLNRHAASGLVIGDRSQWGKGFASEAVRLRTRFAFEELNLERLETESFAENAAMHRALAKAGYHELGRRRRHLFRAGRWHDTILFELLRDEWRARQFEPR